MASSLPFGHGEPSMTPAQKIVIAAAIGLCPLGLLAWLARAGHDGIGFAWIIGASVYVVGLGELSRHLLARPRASTAREVARAVVIALPFMLVLVAASSVIDRHVAGGWLPPWRSATTPDLSAAIVIGLPLAALVLGVIVLVRVRAPRAEDA